MSHKAKSAHKVWQKLIHHFRKQITYMFHLEDKCLKQLTFLLILGGQVELNPGPWAETLYPCQICKDQLNGVKKE
jgi:hypothetical protein